MTARAALLHPITLLAIALLILNDHVLKAAMPGVITGKLSDLAGMVFFPVLLAAALEYLRVRHRHLVHGTAIATGIVFAAIKTIGPAADAYRAGLGVLQWPFRALFSLVRGDGVPALAEVALTMDATDLIVLPALIIPVLLVQRTPGSRDSCRETGTSRLSAV